MSEQQVAVKDDNHVEVLITTTSGDYPGTGTDRVSANQPVKHELKKAADELHIVDTSKWVATVNGTTIDPEKSYADNHLSGTVTIAYGPSEGGGGSRE